MPSGGITAGVVTTAALMFNGLVLGVVTGMATSGGEAGRFVQLVVPHGVLELSCIVVAGTAGLRIAATLVSPGRQPRRQALVREARSAVELALGTAAWLVVAGVVEGFVTPAGIGVVPAVAFGAALGALYWALVWWRGRPSEGPTVTAAPAT